MENDRDPVLAVRAWAAVMLLGAGCWAVFIYALVALLG